MVAEHKSELYKQNTAKIEGHLREHGLLRGGEQFFGNFSLEPEPGAITADDVKKNLEASGNYNLVRIERTFDYYGKPLSFSQAIIVTPKK